MQSDISVLIIEDEEIWAQNIIDDLNQFGFKIVAWVDNLEDALPAISANNFDIALLDINLNGKNSGIELGKIISQTIKKPFIFITGSVNDGIAKETAAVMPSAFLVKPVNTNSLFISIQSALHHFYGGQASAQAKTQLAGSESFFIKVGNKYIKIDWQNVIYLQTEGNYTSIITNDNNTYVIKSSMQRTLQYIIPEASKNSFVQVNRAQVLNIKYIEEIKGDEAKAAGQWFTISDVYAKTLRQQLNIIS
jgi:DNA-binding LytR/AlgR family response regulator